MFALATGLSLNAASRGVQCAIGHFTADEKRDVERLYLSEKAQLMTQKILENIAIAKAVHVLFSSLMRCCFALTDANCPCHCCVAQRYEDAQWEHGLTSNAGYIKYIQTLEAMTEAMEGRLRLGPNLGARSSSHARTHRHVPMLDGGRARVLPRHLLDASSTLAQ
jgi:hypothetical protein